MVINDHTKQLHSKNSAQFYVVRPIHAAPAIHHAICDARYAMCDGKIGNRARCVAFILLVNFRTSECASATRLCLQPTGQFSDVSRLACRLTQYPITLQYTEHHFQ
jgi:hypothetical protein